MSIQDVTSVLVFASGYIQRANTSFGFNSSPTAVDLTLVAGVSGHSVDIANNVSHIIDITGIDPGNFKRVTIGAFDFAGLVQNWTENFGPNGQTYDCRLVDPRIAFDHIPVFMDKIEPTQVNSRSILNPLYSYGSAGAADINDQGMNFDKFRAFLVSGSTTVDIFCKRFKFLMASGYSNTGIIPNWYRIQGGQASLNSVLSSTAQNLGFDWFAYIVPSSVTLSTGTIFIDLVDRIQQTGDVFSDMVTLMNNYQNSGTRMNYKRGKELRTEPAHAVVMGGTYKEWYQPLTSNGKNTKMYWGRTTDGSALFHYSGPDAGTDHPAVVDAEIPSASNRESGGYGIVVLDHICGSYAEAILTNTKVAYEKLQLQTSLTSNTYPPQIVKTATVGKATGYYPSPNMLRAALYSYDSWVAIVCQETPYWAQYILGYMVDRANPNQASACTPFLRQVDFYALAINSGLLNNISLAAVATSGISGRNIQDDVLARAIYEATRKAAETYYGRSWIVDLPTSNWLYSGTYDSSAGFPELEYSVVQSAWADGSAVSTPSGIGNHQTLTDTLNGSLRTQDGEVKAFYAMATTNGLYDFGTFFPTSNRDEWNLPIDFTSIDRSIIVRDQGGDYCIPITIEQYNLSPDRAIITLPFSIEAVLPTSGVWSPEDGVPIPFGYKFSEDNKYFGHFLMGMGYNFPRDIQAYHLLDRIDEQENNRYGLAPPRLYKINNVANAGGFYVPLEYNYELYGPFVYATGCSIGVNVVRDGSLVPATFGGLSKFYTAGNQLAEKSASDQQSVQFAEFTLAGLPVYNIGQRVLSSNITSMTMQYGYEGLTTNYSMRTYDNKHARLGKALLDKVGKVPVIDPQKKETVIIDDIFNIYGRHSLISPMTRSVRHTNSATGPYLFTDMFNRGI